MRLGEDTAWQRLRAARVARLATVDDLGRPHLIPVTFAVDEDRTIITAVDHKPKASTDLKRLRNIRANDHVSVLADHYDDDWTQLWWVRADGTAQVDEPADVDARQLDLLAAKYAQYREHRPAGPVIRIRVTAVHGWAHGRG